MPRFTTIIPTSGACGNIFSILGNARQLMRELGIDDGKINSLSRRVTEASSYDEAKAIIREWFPLEDDAGESDTVHGGLIT